MVVEMYEESDEQRQMRRVAFFAIVVSTVAVIASIVTLPMLYNYVQSFKSHLIVESDFCKVFTFISCSNVYADFTRTLLINKLCFPSFSLEAIVLTCWSFLILDRFCKISHIFPFFSASDCLKVFLGHLVKKMLKKNWL